MKPRKPSLGKPGGSPSPPKRHAAKARQREKERLYRTLFELSPDGILLEDLHGNILDANEALCRSFGYSREELLGQSVRCLVPPEGQGEVEAHLASLQAGRTLEHEVWNLRKNGERCLMRLTETPLWLPDGRQGILVVARDITQSRRAETTKEVFLSLGAQLSAARSPVEAAREIYAAADQLWQWEAATLDLYSPESNRIESVLNCDIVEGQRREVPATLPAGPPSPRMLRVMQQGAELICRVSHDLASGDSVRFGNTRRLTATKMCVPVRRGGQAIGVLSIQSYKPDAYGQEDLRTLQALADYCAGSLERIRASQALQQRELLKEAFLSLGAKLSTARNPADAARAIYASADRLWHWDCGVLDLQLPESGQVETALAYDVVDGERREVLLAQSVGPPSIMAQRVMAQGAELLLRQPGDRQPSDTQLIGDTSRLSASIMRVPVRRENRTVGVLSVQSYTPNAFTQEDLQTLQALADYCGGALERLGSEAALRHSEERYRSLVNNLNVGVYRNTPGPHGRFIQVNPALARMYGYESVEEFQQSRVSDHYQNPADRPRFVAEILRRGTVVNHELRLKRRDGTPIWGSLNATAHLGPDGQVDWIDGVLEDITERKRAEFLLQAQRDLGVNLSLATSLETAFQCLLDVSMQLRGVDCGGVYLLEPASGRMDLVAHRGVSPAFAESVAHLSAEDPRMRQVRLGRPLLQSRSTTPRLRGGLFEREGIRASAIIPLAHEHHIIGALVLASHVDDELSARTQVVGEAIAAQAAGAIARIRAEAEQRRLERQILEISDREQARIGQDIHDGLCQQLVSLAFDANSLGRHLSGQEHPEAVVALRIAELLDQAITESRQLSRGLFPIRLEGEGLAPALEELAKTTRDRFRVRCRLITQEPVRIEHGTVATHLYRIAQEAVTNAVKHSQAKLISLSLRARAGQLELKVEDNGTGFAPGTAPTAAGMGLHIMDYRARSIGGTLRVTPRSRRGTLVSCCVAGPPA